MSKRVRTVSRKEFDELAKPLMQARIPVRAARPGQLVYRFRFSDGGTGDVDALQVKDTEARHLKSLLQVGEETKKEAARTAAETRRHNRELDKRDEIIKQIAAEEKTLQPGAYMKNALRRVNEKFPEITFENLKKLIK